MGGSNEDNASDVRETNKIHEDLSGNVAQNVRLIGWVGIEGLSLFFPISFCGLKCLRWELLCLFAIC